MTEYLVTDRDMTKVADAIRAKGNITDPLSFPDGMAAMINSIQSGGGGVEGVDISFINAVNNSPYDGNIFLYGVFGRIECNFASNNEYTFEIPKPIPINELFNEFSAIFDTPTNYPMIFSLNIIGGNAGQSGLLVKIQRA